MKKKPYALYQFRLLTLRCFGLLREIEYFGRNMSNFRMKIELDPSFMGVGAGGETRAASDLHYGI